MPELRQNLVTRDWVVIATERAKRPDEFKKETKLHENLPILEANCPFCPGNETKTPYETYTIRDQQGHWKVRVIPNKYAALVREGVLERKMDGLKRSMSGVGIHEVVIETPLHNLDIPQMPENEVGDIIGTYRERYNELLKDNRLEMIMIFRNHGEMAGTSLIHPHSQIIGTPVVPAQVRHRIEIATQYFDDTGECIGCRLLNDELKAQERIISESAHFVTFVPYASLSPFHTWIFPKRHISSFGNITDAEVEDLAFNLKAILTKLYLGLADPDYNYCIRSIPCDEKEIEHFHWYLTIIPRLTKTAGFELGSGMFINPTIPEENAAFLRSIKVR